MIKEDDLILAENAMEKSIEKIGYLLNTISGKKIISSISIEDIFKKAEKEYFNYTKHCTIANLFVKFGGSNNVIM